MIFIIDSNKVMARCVGRATKRNFRIFSNGIAAMEALAAASSLPELIFLDILLDGPDGFTFLNELVSYDDTAAIPIVIISSLILPKRSLRNYGVAAILDKETMTPSEIQALAKQFSPRITHAHIPQ